MMRTLIEKELRENLRWLLVGLALICPLLWYATPRSLAGRIVDTENGLAAMLLLGATLFAIGLGVMQSFADLRTASRSFLFHRSVSVGSIFYSKLISGAILYFAATGIPLCVIAIWFAWQGLDYLPVRPIQVYPAAVVALGCFGFHPATMLMLARSGKWFGTKLLPLLFVLPIVMLALFTLSTIVHGPEVHVLIVALILLGILTLVAAAKHAWVHSVADEGGFPKQPVSLALKVTLSFAAVAFVSLSFGIVFNLTEGWLHTVPSNAKEDYAIDADGNCWWAISKRIRDDQMQVFVSGAPLQMDKLPDVRRTLPENVKLHDLGHMSAVVKPRGCFASEMGFYNKDRSTYFDIRGSVLLYDRTLNPPLQESISRDGKPFAGDPRGWNHEDIFFYEKKGPSFWIDSIGAYRLLGGSHRVETLVELPIQGKGEVTRFESMDDQAKWSREITILSDGKLHVYRLTDMNGNEWFPFRERVPSGFEIREIAVSPPLPPCTWRDIRFHFADDSKFTVILTGRRPSFLKYNSKSDTDWTSTPFRNPKMDIPTSFGNLAFSVLPSLYSIVNSITLAVDSLLNGNSLPSIDEIKYFLQDEYSFVILAIGVVLLAMVGTRFACHRRMLSRSETVRWCCWALLLGLATPIAVLAIYTQPACTRCTRCAKQRRMDLRHCEHCGSDWERPTPTGIEIFDESVSGSREFEVAIQ